MQWKLSVPWHVGRVLYSTGYLQTLFFWGHKPTPKACLQRAAMAHLAGSVHKAGHWFSSKKVFHLLFFFFLIHFPGVFSGMLTIRHTNPCRNSLRVVLSVPADEKNHYLAMWSRSSRSFITQRRITEKLLTTFPLSGWGVYSCIMQISYAFLFILFFILPIFF